MRKRIIPALALASLGLVACGGGGGSSTSTGTLVFSEIMYQGAGTDSLEFLELRNDADSTIPLAGLAITGAVAYQFGADAPTLKPGAMIVITNLTEDFATRFPGVLAYGPYTGHLSNSGEKLQVTTIDSTVVAECEYGVGASWPAMAAGGGYSLVYTGLDQTKGDSWSASLVAGGNPGAKDKVAPAMVVQINEVVPVGSTGGAWIELANTSSKAVDVSGWLLTDSIGDPNAYSIPAGTSVPAHGFVVLSESAWSASTLAPALTGGDLYLIRTESGVASGSSNTMRFLSMADGSSAGLAIMSDGTVETSNFSTPTPGAANGSATVGPLVVSEMMYNPDSNNVEYMELTNISADTLKLADGSDVSFVYKVEGVGFSFPTGATLAPNSKVVLIRADDIDTASFRTKYSVPSSVAIYAYPDKLSNSGERVEVKRPFQAVLVGAVPQYVMTWSDIVDYTDVAPWPLKADGDGQALYRKDNGVAGSDPSNWSSNAPTPGQ